MENSHPPSDPQHRREPAGGEEQPNLVSVRGAIDWLLRSNLVPDTGGREQPEETPRSDNNVRNECRRDLTSFKKCVKAFQDHLNEFTRAVRPLGSSIQIVRSANMLKELMNDLANVFGSNCVSIYTSFSDDNGKPPDDLRMYSPQKRNFKPKAFTVVLEDISKTLDRFLKSLTDIPEFSDDNLKDSIYEFKGWLVYQKSSLESFEDKLQTPTIERYTNYLMLAIMSRHMKETGEALKKFTKDGVSTLKEAQDRAREQLLNLSTMATFFSAVASTTFQYTSGGQESNLGQVVRALWVSSLILSVASAINSQLAMHWNSTMHRSPNSALPVWTLLCLNHTPIIFLVASVLTFSLGLVLYTYASSQGRLVNLCATILTSITSFILLTVITWEGVERWRAWKSRRPGWKIFGRKAEKQLPHPVLSRGALGMAVGSPLHLLGPLVSSAEADPMNAKRDPRTRNRRSRTKTQDSQSQWDMKASSPMSPSYSLEPLKNPELVNSLVPGKGSGAIRDVTFSPDGKWLAASYTNEMMDLWSTTGNFGEARSFISHSSGIKWSPNSRYLLARQERGVLILSPMLQAESSGSEVLKSELSVPDERIKAVGWLPDGNKFAAITKGTNMIYIINAETGESDPYPHGITTGFDVHDMASIPGQSLIIGVGHVRPEGFYSSSKPPREDEFERMGRMLVYDTENNNTGPIIPICGEALHVSVSRDGKSALVSYKAPRPPELWKISISAKRVVSLDLQHIYSPNKKGVGNNVWATEFIGQARFGGDQEEYVVATNKKGEAYIWDTQTTQQLLAIDDARGTATNNHAMDISWCTTNGDTQVPMLACGLDNARIVIWKGKSQDIRSESPEIQAGSNAVDLTNDEQARLVPSRSNTLVS